MLEELEILNKLDKETYPETYEYLNKLADEPLYEIALTILELDRPKRFPDFMIDFITKLLEWEIFEGNDDAMNTLGSYYYDGDRGFEQSFDRAVFYYKMAADHGNWRAQENLGYCYYYGRVGDPDYEKAFHYFALGAFDGRLISLYKIGDMYLNGLYVEQNEREAFSIYRRCLKEMTEEMEDRVAGPVCLRMGRMFLEGIGVEQSYRAALDFFQRAERYLLDMVISGQAMYRKSLEEAVEGQLKARKGIALPEDEGSYCNCGRGGGKSGPESGSYAYERSVYSECSHPVTDGRLDHTERDY